MIRSWFRVTMALGSLALGIASAWAQPQGQAPQMQRQQQPQLQPQQPQPQQLPAQPQQQIAPGQCTAPDRVAVTALSVNPQQPTPGQVVTVALTIRNVCNGHLAYVPWRIEVGTGSGPNQLLGSGVQQNVPAGASFTATANWTATPGQRGLLGTADPDNMLRESPQSRGNNYKDFAFNVAQPPPPRLVMQTLDYDKAHSTGARFGTDKQGLSPCDFYNVREGAKVLFKINCNILPGGGRANFTAYDGYRLKNGWKVKDYSVTAVQARHVNQGNYEVTAPPAIGSDNPFVQVHLVSAPNELTEVLVQITIEGPEGTDPYK